MKRENYVHSAICYDKFKQFDSIIYKMNIF